MMDEQMPAGTPVAEPTTTELQAPPPAPPAVTAALSGEERKVRRLIRDLGDIDVRLEAKLSGLVAAIKSAIEQEVAKETIKLLPPRSKQRAALRELPPADVWDAVGSDVRGRVDVAVIARRVATQFEPEVVDVFDDAARQVAETWAERDGTPQLLVDQGRRVLLAGVIAEVADVFDDSPVDAVDAADGNRDQVQARKRRRAMRSGASSMTVRSAMAAAGGGEVDGADRLVPSQSGMPSTVDGSPWQGSTGMALGHQAAVAFGNDPNWRLGYEWRHSFFGRPKEPFLPHKALDGERFRDATDVPGGLFPGDHPHCRCALIWVPEQLK